METQIQEFVGSPVPTIRHALVDASEYLKAAGIEAARLDAEVLLRHVLSLDTAQLYSNLDSLLSPADEKSFKNLLARRAAREPIGYITGHKEFWSLDFEVNPNVLIPRPETELLVEAALQYLRRRSGSPNPQIESRASSNPLSKRGKDGDDCRASILEVVRILDIGSGSGAIAIALAKELPQAEIWAVDVSAAALDATRRNAARHGVEDRIRLVHGDLFPPVGQQTGMFDLIVSNPPYIKTEELAQLAPEICEWEPVAALDGGADGLTYYRRIFEAAGNYLRVGGQLLFETDSNLALLVADLFQRDGEFATPVVYQDYAGNDRVIGATRILSQSTPTEFRRG